MIKENDFVEIDYTGIVAEDGFVFDTTLEKVAKENGILNQKITYKPAIIEVGKNHIIRGLDKSLVGQKTESKFSVELTPEEAFGKKDAKLIRMIPTAQFIKQKINPFPGLQVTIDNQIATIKTVSGGRCMVDFNHPLSGKDIKYDVKIHKIITDDATKVKTILELELRLNSKMFDVETIDGKVVVKFDKNIPAEQLTPVIKKRFEKSNIESEVEIKNRD